MAAHAQETGGGIIGGLVTILAYVSPETIVETIVCAAIGAGVGYLVTYFFKKMTGWGERKLLALWQRKTKQ